MANDTPPSAPGQLVWSPGDPQLGIGLVTEIEGTQVRVRFLRLQEDRAYTTRSRDLVIARFLLRPGDRVRDIHGEDVSIQSAAGEDDAGLVRYALNDGREVVESELVPNVVDVGAAERLANLNLVHPEVVRARIQGLQLSAVGARPGFAAVLGARVEWLPHQVDVAARAIESDSVRMLLADEVGLGKTVEAALIYAGLRSEGRAQRVLILTPTALCIQWLGELFRKTHELLVLLDGPRLEDARQDFPDLSPFEAYQRIVASIDIVAQDEELVQEAMAADWDLVVVDEAHHLRWRPDGQSNDAYRLVEGLAQQTRHLLLLTATPMALDPAEYHALLRLLEPTRFDDPAAFEAIASRVAEIRALAQSIDAAITGDKALDDEAATLAQRVLGDEPEDLERFEQLAALSAESTQREDAAQHVLEVLRERHGLADYVVRNRRGPVGGLPERRPQVIPLTPSDAQAELIELGEGLLFELTSTFDDPAQRHQTLGKLLRALWAAPRAVADILRPVSASLTAELEPHIEEVIFAPLDDEGLPTADSRLRWLVQYLREAEADDEKVLVFVESSVAVRALKQSLEGVLGADVAWFHRGLAPRDQDRQVAWFRDPDGPQVMLSTEAGGEGRNFQFCHKVVLYDLPWRPATIEQRIGRVDRVGQKHDVEVLVPHFESGYEAAILKIMQQSIGVLDRTVGGIDHALEYVSDRLAELILEGAGADAWKSLYRETSSLVERTRSRIEAEVDPILDHASFSPERAQGILGGIPADLEARAEAVVQRYASHSRMRLHPKGGPLVDVEGAPGAAGRDDSDSYMATFSRTHALDHEDVEFLSFGHPLVQQALEWCVEGGDASAALALCRGFPKEGAVFLWHFHLDLPDDVPEAAAYFERLDYTVAVDESGKRVPEMEKLLGRDARPFDRMDPKPLRAAISRWRQLVDRNHQQATELVKKEIEDAVAGARTRFSQWHQRRERDLERMQRRERSRCLPEQLELLEERHEEEVVQLNHERSRMLTAFEHARSRLLAAVAVRLMRAKQVSG